MAYSDAATGAKQIRLLGLSGTYVQLLTENIPNFRGASSASALDYVPGPWLQSISVSKGTASVKNGYEAISGQIDIEYKKPQNPHADWVAANVFTSSTQRYEANVDGTFKLGDKWRTTLLAHYGNETKPHDSNMDGFVDLPMTKQYNFFNRWTYTGKKYNFQAGVKILGDNRLSGQDGKTSDKMIAAGAKRYRIDIDTRRYEFYSKNAVTFNHEKMTNIALILNGSSHSQDSYYGVRSYNVDQYNIYSSLLFESDFGRRSNISAGLSLNWDSFRQKHAILFDNNGKVKDNIDELVPGGYVQYTYNLNDKLVLMAGIRGDWSSEYGFFITPRAHIRWTPSDHFNSRIAVGKGYRTPHILAENNNLLASSRRMVLPEKPDQEEAWNFGINLNPSIPIAGKHLNINGEYYYTSFRHQVVADLDSDPHAVTFFNLDGKSFSHVAQVEMTYPFFEGFTFTTAWRWTSVRQEIAGPLYPCGRLSQLEARFQGIRNAQPPGYQILQ